MGFLFSKPVEKPAPQVQKEEVSPEALIMLQRFNTKYPDLKFVLTRINSAELNSFLSKVPVPTEEQLYTFLLEYMKQKNDPVKPTDTQVEKLLSEYSQKYSYMEEYLDNIEKLDTEKQVLANKTMQDFLETYPLGSVDDFYKLQISILKSYSLALPPEEEGFCNKNTTKNMNYSKISVQMDSIISNKDLLKKEYASFSR
jgi:hypothetical protein